MDLPDLVGRYLLFILEYTSRVDQSLVLSWNVGVRCDVLLELDDSLGCVDLDGDLLVASTGRAYVDLNLLCC